MKNLFKAFALTAMIMLSASCIKENNAESVSGLFRTYNLSFAEATKTELSGTGSTRQVSWSEGDEIQYYTVSKQANAASVAVIVSGSSAYVEIPRGRTDEFINAVYGAAQLKSSSSTESIMYVSSPVKSEQSYTSFGQAHICAAFSDDIENSKLSFHNVAAILKFTSSADIHKVVFYGNNNETVSAGNNGDLKITYAGGALTTEAASTGGKTITVATDVAESDYYIAILPVNFSAGFSLDCYDSDNTLIFTKKTANAINTVSTSGAPKILNLGSVQDWIANVPPTAVDLGLSVKWATFNVGATRPEEYGDYFAWGETTPKDEYKWANYQFGNSKNGPFSKYVLDAAYGTVDHKTVLDLNDDAAHAAWGDDWRMPTKEEVSELMNSSNCTWTWTTNNGVPGYKVTSRKSGYTANSIFLPANGMKSGTSLSDAGTMGNYWTSSISAGYPYYAISPFFDLSKTNSDNCYRYFGLGVRPVQGAVVPVSSITIPETLTLLIGASQSLSTTVLPENATYKNLTWTCSDETVVSVDANGKVTSITPGTATVTAYSADGGVKAECVVSSNQLAESITLDKTSLEMYIGDDPVQLTATILPETTTDKTVTWSSSKTSIATVDEDGQVTAIANGTATITAKAKDGSGKSATCAVTVRTHVESVSLNKTKITLYNGDTTSLTATVLPSNASNKSVTWASSDDSIATVIGSGTSATVKGISGGDVTITATSVDGGRTATCALTVKEPDFNGHEYVDLGLPSGLKWATMNVGAAKPEEYGDYFAWGETEPYYEAGYASENPCTHWKSGKTGYNWASYKWCNGNYNKLTKYCTNSLYWDSSEPMDNKTVLDLEDDAAHVNWGGSWRMPTSAEWAELFKSCTWTWTTQNGVNGRLGTGPNGNSIFLPAAGFRDFSVNSSLRVYVLCWYTTLSADPSRAWNVGVTSNSINVGKDKRYLGRSVRPVT